MKFYEVAVILFSVGLAIGLLNSMSIVSVSKTVETPSFAIIEEGNISSGIEAEKPGGGFLDMIWGFSKAVGFFIDGLSFATYPYPTLAYTFGVPSMNHPNENMRIPLAETLQALVTFIYIIGLASFLRGYSIERS